MRIAVCDDEEQFLAQAEELLRELCPNYFGGTINDTIVIDRYTDNLKMLLQHEKEPYDIVLMDIKMPVLDGFMAAERLSAAGRECKLIFFSSKEELVFQSFQYEPVYFVRKGGAERMRAELSRALKRIREKYDKRVFLYFPDKNGMMERVPVTEIESIQSDRNYLIYSTLSGREYRQRKTMEEEEQSLKEYGFLRIHRAFLVNSNYVARIRQNGSEVQMKSGKLLKVGRNYRQAAEKFFCAGAR